MNIHLLLKVKYGDGGCASLNHLTDEEKHVETFDSQFLHGIPISKIEQNCISHILPTTGDGVVHHSVGMRDLCMHSCM